MRGVDTAQEPSVTILHISDTQFGQYHRFDAANSLADAMVRDIAKLPTLGVPPVNLIIVSGDITETGMPAEFGQARAFLDAVCRHTDLDNDHVVVVPGNHDVTWALAKAYFAECEGYGREPAPPYPKKWEHYRQFVTGLHGEPAFTEDRPYRVHRFDDLPVAVAALNSTIMESHLDHYGHCGRDQLSWLADQLAPMTGLLRIGVLHHNARRKAQDDNENLRDEPNLTNLLHGRLDLLLHGHTHEGTEDRLPDGTLVLATGSAAVTAPRRPDEVPNQYQVLHIRPGQLTRWARQWDPHRHQWIADPRASRDGNAIQVRISLPIPGWEKVEASVRRPGQRDRIDPDGRPGLGDGADPFEPPGERFAPPGGATDLVAMVERVTRTDLGGDAVVERRSKGDPPVPYLVAHGPAAPLRYVGVVDGCLDQATLDRIDEEAFAPVRGHSQIQLYVVHRGPDDPGLRTAALRRGIRVRTWAEYNDLLDPSAYRTWLKTELEADRVLYPLDLYQPQRFRDIDRYTGAARAVRGDLLPEVFEAAAEDEGRFVLILGEAGYGKSFLMRRLAHQMLTDEQVSVTPIVIYLRDRDKRQSIDEMVASVLIPSRATFRADRFQHSLEAGTLALLVDGYDEFAVRVGYANAAAQLRTFINAMQGKARVILTTRPSHFRSTDEVTSALFDSLQTVHQARVYQLEPFDEEQQRAFLTRWFELKGDADPPGTAHQWMAALADVDNLPELARTPRMLSFMAEDLALAAIRQAASEGTVTAADLYQRLVGRWLQGEAAKVDPDDERKLSAGKRLELLEDMALQLWRVGERDVSEATLQQIARKADLPKLDLTLDQAAQVIGGRTLLRVDRNRWRFAHQSVWEFLLARRLAVLLRAGASDDLLGEAELTGLTIRFLRDLAPQEAAGWASRVARGGAA